MRVFVRLKAWQLFLVLIGPPVVLQAILPAPAFFAGGVIFCAILYGWVFSIGFYANQLLPNVLRRSPFLFTAGLVYATVYGALLFSLVSLGHFPPLWIFPFHLLAMAGVFYGLWFSAKQLTTLKEHRHVGFVDYSGPFFLMWFSPVGVWFVQPITNRYVAADVAPANGGDRLISTLKCNAD